MMILPGLTPQQRARVLGTLLHETPKLRIIRRVLLCSTSVWAWRGLER